MAAHSSARVLPRTSQMASKAVVQKAGQFIQWSEKRLRQFTAQICHFCAKSSVLLAHYYNVVVSSEYFSMFCPLLLPFVVVLILIAGVHLYENIIKLVDFRKVAQVVGWLGVEMLWLILSWGLVAAICYFALQYLGASQEGNLQSSAAGSRQQPHLGRENVNSNEWTNEVLAWMHNNFHKVPAPLEAWIRSLNEAAKKVTTPTKCEVLFEGFGDHHDVLQPPKLSNVRVEHGPRDHLTLRSDVHLPCIRLRLVSSQRTAERMIVSNFDASIIDLRGEVECRMACIANQLYLMGCFSGRPEMDIDLSNTDPNAQYQVSPPMVEESIRRCLLSAVTNINLSEALPSEVRDTFADTFSRTIYTPPTHSPSATVRNSYNNYDSNLHADPYSMKRSSSPTQVPEMFKKLNESHLITPSFNSSTVPNKMRVKVIKASRLGRDVHQPYVVIEMDEPAQKFTTTKGINANPYWEEEHDFELTPATEELLFEVYEGNEKVSTEEDHLFLGLAIVNFEEIRRSGEALHTLKLQGRPYRNDDVSGELSVQFEFFYDPNVVTTGKLTDTVKVVNPNGSEFRETVTTERRPVYDPHDNYDGALEITPTKTTTVLVKTVSHQLKEKPTIQSVHGSLENAVDPATQKILDNTFRNSNDPKTLELEAKLRSVSESAREKTRSLERQGTNGSANYYEEPRIVETDESRRGRDRSKKKMDMKNVTAEEDAALKGQKAWISTANILKKPFHYRPAEIQAEHVMLSARFLKEVDTQRQTLWEAELEHEKQPKYFLIPPSMLNEPAAARLMRKGKKLHIYNEHTFVAVKIRGGATCNVCQHRIRSSFSKQAYQCRDCKLVCHKSCHYKTDAFCTQSTVSKLHIAKDVDWAHYLSHYQLEEFISQEGLWDQWSAQDLAFMDTALAAFRFRTRLMLHRWLWLFPLATFSAQSFLENNEDFCAPVYDLVVLLDTSGSIDKVFEEQVKWTIAIAKVLPVHQSAVRISLIQYAEKPLTEFNLTRYSERQDMIEHLTNIAFQSGISKSGAALSQAAQELFSSEGRKNALRSVVIFTEGLSTDNPAGAAEDLRRRGVRVHAISVSSDGFIPEMLSITGNSDRIYGPTDIERLQKELLNEVETSRRCAKSKSDFTKIKTFQRKNTTFDSQQVEKSETFTVMSTRTFTRSIPLTVTQSSQRRESQTSKKNYQNYQTTKNNSINIVHSYIYSNVSHINGFFLKNDEILEDNFDNGFQKILKRLPTLQTITRKPLTTKSVLLTTTTPPTVFISSILEKSTKTSHKSELAKDSQIFSKEESGAGRCPLDVLFIVDSSGSMGDVYEAQKEFITSIIRHIEPASQSHRAALIQFAGRHLQKTEWSFETHLKNSQLMRAMRNVRHLTGTTYIGEALKQAASLLETRRKNVETLVLLITDGFSQDDPTPQAKYIRQLQNVRLYAISLAPLTDMNSLGDIVGGDRQKIYSSDETHAIEDLIASKAIFETRVAGILPEAELQEKSTWAELASPRVSCSLAPWMLFLSGHPRREAFHFAIYRGPVRWSTLLSADTSSFSVPEVLFASSQVQLNVKVKKIYVAIRLNSLAQRQTARALGLISYESPALDQAGSASIPLGCGVRFSGTLSPFHSVGCLVWVEFRRFQIFVEHVNPPSFWSASRPFPSTSKV
ncbi:unnamed protein product [Caenorhabditis auriculariae]|uniref:Uncharacterized protein n=1 Tax=Caenorhabditis auriculariae TaxID=2777116 RepID=A0A8S1H5H1_9PELO|nr:unnamed protein product [Caenorhabditis auriculariae]